MDFIDESADIEIIPALKMSDVVMFLRQCGRSEVCPFCGSEGPWDFHVETSDSAEDEDDPLMTVFNVPINASKRAHHAVAITCPKCAHFSMFDIDRIKLHIFRHMRAQELTHG